MNIFLDVIDEKIKKINKFDGLEISYDIIKDKENGITTLRVIGLTKIFKQHYAYMLHTHFVSLVNRFEIEKIIESMVKNICNVYAKFEGETNGRITKNN